ncbi:Two-component transcriptional response regulator, LuxR family [hydrothermal vent metagenome]|uniref:Two-component transcriptional response regulator, LuxR family n=1 Tax=hydrothermal vent metagenome TaxID=652676 RepID=A0A3B1CNL9_9ZZZZ
MEKTSFIALMAEDNKHDIIATRRAWQENKIANTLYVVNDGEECLDYLYQRGKYSDPKSAPQPGILLLDINMPKMNGHEVLDQIRGEPKFCNLPVIILTTSKAEEDRVRSYDLGATAYIKKPVGFENLSHAVKTINLFWEMVELPKLANALG